MQFHRAAIQTGPDKQTRHPKEYISRSVVLLAVIAGLGLLAGLGREMAVAAIFGASNASDLFFVATIPIQLFMMLSTDASMAMLPTMVHLRQRWGDVAGNAYLKYSLRGTSLLCGLAVGIIIVFAPQIVAHCGEGLDAGGQQMAVTIMRWTGPIAALIVPVLLLKAAINAGKRFVWPQLATLLPNMALIVAALGLGSRWGVWALALGLALGHLGQAVWLGILTQRQRVSQADPGPGGHGDAARRARRRYFLVWALIITGALASKAELFMARHYASMVGEGTISAFNYAYRIAQLPIVLFAMAMATVVFPYLSEKANGPIGHFTRFTSKSIAATGGVLILTAVAGYFAAGWVVQVLLVHGRFNAADAELTVLLFRVLCFSILPIGLVALLIRCVLALDRPWIYAITGVMTLLIYVSVCGPLVQTYGAAGLAWANVVANSALALMLLLCMVAVLIHRSGRWDSPGIWAPASRALSQ